MMTSYFNLLKYAQTGIASPDMSYFDKMRASTLMGGVVQTLTGQPPLTFKGDGTPLISWSMKGNGSQTGTPTPDAPIMPEFVGVRTGNLFDKGNRVALEGYIDSTGTIISNSLNACVICKVEPSTSYTVSADMVCTNGNRIAEFTEKPAIGSQGTVAGTIYPPNPYQFTITTGQNTNYIAFHRGVSTVAERQEFYGKIMLNLGSTALPYEPFGWAEKITCAGQTVPVYLGQAQTVRRIKKVVFTGQETWTEVYPGEPEAQAQGIVMYSTSLSEIGTDRNDFRCSHFFVGNYRGYLISGQGRINGTATSAVPEAFTVNYNNGFGGLQNFKAWLASEYAAGHPVTLWYVLATEQTGIVNEPLAKIGTYADELSSEDAAVTISTVRGQNTLTVDTELQPSEMTITFK